MGLCHVWGNPIKYWDSILTNGTILSIVLPTLEQSQAQYQTTLYYCQSINLKIIHNFFFQCTHGSGIFELQVLEMANPRSELSSSQCCGGGQHSPISNRCSTPCQTFFRLCLKEYQSNVTSTGSCSFGNTSSQVLGRDTFTLADPERGKLVLPFTFRWTVSLKLIFYICWPCATCCLAGKISTFHCGHLRRRDK